MKKFFIIPIATLFISLIIVNLDMEDEKVIKYFPFDESKSITNPETELTYLKETDSDTYQIAWSIHSNTDEPVFLRQDLSLLFVDGKLKGILNQWKEDVSMLEQQTIFNGEDSSHFEAISFHHGEIHYDDNSIKSIQAMTFDELYVIDSPHTHLDSFKAPVSEYEKEWKKTLDHTKYQQLTYYWKRLMEHYHLSTEDYIEIPLSQLHYYQKQPFPTLTIEETQQVIGQFWEGLYRHYVLGINMGKKDSTNSLNSFMPLILVDKQGKYLYVLYEDAQGTKHRLIQQIPKF